MSGKLVVAYGNPQRGDEGAGWHIAHRLQHEELPDVEVLTCHQLLPELAQKISTAQLVVFLGTCSGDEPGEVYCRRLSIDENRSASSDWDPQVLLAYTRALYGRCPQAFAVSMVRQSATHSRDLSPRVVMGLRPMLERIRLLLAAGPVGLAA